MALPTTVSRAGVVFHQEGPLDPARTEYSGGKRLPQPRFELLVPFVLIFQMVTSDLLMAQSPEPRFRSGNAYDARLSSCMGKYKHGLKPPSIELTSILKRHAEWAKHNHPLSHSFERNDSVANLCQADLEN